MDNLKDWCHCQNAGQHLHHFDYGESRIFIVQNGRYMQIFDDEYPGFSDAFEINFCPVCGRRLSDRLIIPLTKKDLPNPPDVPGADICDCAPSTTSCEGCPNDAECERIARHENERFGGIYEDMDE